MQPEPSSAAMNLPAEALQRFHDCMEAATAAGDSEPTAMTLATWSEAEGVTARMVLLKGYDAGGFVFYTNTLSLKGRQLAAHPSAALVWYWKVLDRQVRVHGTVELVPDAEADAYFAGRPRGSQLGAWASRQSEPLASRARLVKEVLQFEFRHLGRKVPRPPHWAGYRVVPDMIEFWYGRASRLHDRIRYRLEADGWVRQRLYP